MAVISMGDRTAAALLLSLLLLFALSLVPARGHRGRGLGREEGEERTSHGGGSSRGLFILGKTRKAVRTEAGQVRIVSGHRLKGDPKPMHIGFLRMEPNSLFLPQYVDANLILFLRRGEVEVGWIHKDELVQRKLKRGDINVIPAGSAFYIVNSNSERSHMVCSIDTSESLGYNSEQSFFIGGGTNPTSVLAGFDTNTLSNAFNITSDQLRPLMRSQSGGPIVHFSGRQEKAFDLNDGEEEDSNNSIGEKVAAWARKNLVNNLLGRTDQERIRQSQPHHAPRAYNLYNNEPSFQNSYGWSTAINEHDYSPLSCCGIGVYIVNLTAGSMLAPHYNPMATEYGVVVSGSGTIQVVFPNGTTAMNAEVSEGDVFWIPRYHPFCQVASRGGPMEFFGFTTSSKRNHPQFLVGASSVLRSMRGPELARAFGVSEEQLERLVKAQRESVILPAANSNKETVEEEERRKKKREEEEKLVEELILIKRGFLA